MPSYTTRNHTLTCDCKKWSCDMRKEGIQICDCAKYTYTLAKRPHRCGCSGKMETVRSISYGKTKDYI